VQKHHETTNFFSVQINVECLIKMATSHRQMSYFKKINLSNYIILCCQPIHLFNSLELSPSELYEYSIIGLTLLNLYFSGKCKKMSWNACNTLSINPNQIMKDFLDSLFNCLQTHFIFIIPSLTSIVLERKYPYFNNSWNAC